MKKTVLMRRAGPSVALILWALGTMPCRAQTPAEPEFARVEESVAALAKKASELRSLPQGPDVPGIRETVRRLEIHVSRTCIGTAPRYALKPVAPDLGPSLPAYADSLTSWYFYPNEAGLRLDLAGDGPGAALSIGSAEGALHALGTIAHEEGPCRPYSSVQARLEIAAGVAATISVAPRTGFFRPACYKDPINGFHKLDTWTVLTIVLPQETLTVRTADGMSFHNKQSCLDYYERAKANQ
jgi:hypothetical protein